MQLANACTLTSSKTITARLMITRNTEPDLETPLRFQGLVSMSCPVAFDWAAVTPEIHNVAPTFFAHA
jgi:hypothetical protein